MKSINKSCSIRKIRRPNTGEFREYSSDKLGRRLNEVLKDVYKDLRSALNKLEIMLPEKIYLKNLISLFSYLKIPFTVDELKCFINSNADSFNKFLPFDKFSQILTEIDSKKISLSVDKRVLHISEGTSTCDIIPKASPMHKMIKEKFKSLLLLSLTEKFDNFVDAFQFATNQKTITYFGFLKLVKFLQIPADENLASEYFNSVSKNGHLTIGKFKTIWYNTEGLCAVTLCSNPVEVISEYCSSHLDQVRSKGKQEFQRMLSDLDLRSQVYVKNLLKKNPFPDARNLKNVLDGVSIRKYSRDSWKSIATYINTKEPDLCTYTPITKLKRSINSSASLPRKSKNRLRHQSLEKCKLQVISFSNDTVVLKSSFD